VLCKYPCFCYSYPLAFSSPRIGYTALCAIAASLSAICSLVSVPVLHAIDAFESTLPVITADDFRLRQSIRITDRAGNEMYRTYDDEDRIFLSLDRIPPVVQNAFIAIEDERLHQRPCVDVRAVLRAAYKTYIQGEREGGSTITQQLVRSITGEREITIKRKIREMFAACSLEHSIGKTGVLEQYLNRINFGGTLYGVQSASRAYFGMPVELLDAPRAAILAAIVQRPSYYAPGGRLQKVPDRAQDVLAAMRRLGFLSRGEYKDAIAELPAIPFREPNPSDHPPFPFVFEILNRADRALTIKNVPEAATYSGLTIRTTLDPSIQSRTDAAIREVFPAISAQSFARDVAAVVLDRETRDVLAYIGNSDWGGNPDSEWVDLASAPRQVGSAFKPIVYAAYFENGKTGDTEISDWPMQIGYMKPRNFEGGFLGKISVKTAIAWSRNIPAIRVFLDIGEDRVLRLASAMGAPTPLLERDRRRRTEEGFTFGWPMAIGSAELPLYELVQAYGTIAEGGVASPMHTIASIRASDGHTLYEPPATIRKQILQPHNADMLADILRDWDARPDRWNVVIDLPREWNAALKTGTSNICRARKFDGNCAVYGVLNTVAVGFTDRYVIGVLVANADNSPLHPDADGLNAAVPVWTAIIRKLAEQSTGERFTESTGSLLGHRAD
jgi:membrane peptidoglycan carboxypeptidase